MDSKTDFDISDEDYKSLSPDEKERYVFQTLKQIIDQNPDGVTKSEIQEITSFGRKTIDKHLEKYVALNEGYVRRMGGTDVYYPNGRLLHSSINEVREIDGKTFKAQHLESMTGESIYIQEIEPDEFDEEVVKGGMLIPKDVFQDFVDWLANLTETVEETNAQS